MIYLYASSSNEISLIPSSSMSTGEEVRLLFTNRFSEATSSISLNVTSSGDWIKAPITLPTDIDLSGGSYDLVLQKAVGEQTAQIWGTSTEVYSTSKVVWSVGTVDDRGYINDTTTTAFVSESIGRVLYTSANENGAFVVYEG